MKKICKKCEKEKSIGEFNNFKHSKDGKSPYCRVCKYEIDKISYHKNKEKNKEKRRKYREENNKLKK